MTKEMCIKVVEDYPGTVEFVPDHLKIQTMCDDAVRS